MLPPGIGPFAQTTAQSIRSAAARYRAHQTLLKDRQMKGCYPDPKADAVLCPDGHSTWDYMTAMRYCSNKAEELERLADDLEMKRCPKKGPCPNGCLACEGLIRR